MSTLIKIIKRSDGKMGLKLLPVLALSLFLVTLGGCCTLIPVNPDSNQIAPTLAPPLVQRGPSVGTSVGCLAPDFKLTGLDGQAVKFSDYRGQPVLLNFWTYCDACKEELPYIQSVYDQRGLLAPDLVVLAVNVTQPVDQVQQFVQYYGYTFQFLLDGWGTVASDFYIHKIPTTFFIDKNGIVQDIQVGAFSGQDALQQKVVALNAR